MNSLRHAIILGILLIVIGAGTFAYKIVVLGYPAVPDKGLTSWTYELFVEFDGRDEPARIDAFLPAGDVARTFPREQFYSGPFGLTLSTQKQTRNRTASWTYRYPSNRKVLRYMAQTTGESERTPLPESFINTTPAAPTFEEDPVRRQAFIVWTGDLRRRTADNESYVNMALSEIFDGRSLNNSADELSVLLTSQDTLGRLKLAQMIIEAAGMPARIANGVYLTETRRRVETRQWLEYHMNGRSHRYFPAGTPSRFFTIWYGDAALVSANGVDNLDAQITLQREVSSFLDIAERSGKLGAEQFRRLFSFEALPVTTQLVYKVLVTIPVGIALLVFLRQFIGLKTLGTFMPVLIGIAFRDTALLNGLFLFTTLVVLGLTLRFYLERLQLLLVPRLAVVVIFIVIVMGLLTVLFTESNQSIGLSISLFPIVILTMTIERMSIVWEESSPGEALQQGLGSLLVAAIAYLAMTNIMVEHLMYLFPELLLVLMGLCVLMGRYTGLRLTELWRFRSLAK